MEQSMSTPRIDSYRFGRIVIDNETFNKDVIIFPDRVFGPWWRDEGHVLQTVDLTSVFEAAPGVLVVGQGAYSRMHVPEETQRAIEAAGIKLISLPTGKACDTYNSLREQGKIVAALHLTC
jgi:hypothetical protein